MGKNYFLSTDFWSDTTDVQLMHDEFRVYTLLRHPPESTFTSLDEHREIKTMIYTAVTDRERYQYILTILSKSFDGKNRPLIIYDGLLFFVPGATHEHRMSAGRNFYACLERTRKLYSKYKSERGLQTNAAYAAFLEHWKDEFLQIDEGNDHKKQKSGGIFSLQGEADLLQNGGTLRQGELNLLQNGGTLTNSQGEPNLLQNSPTLTQGDSDSLLTSATLPQNYSDFGAGWDPETANI